MNDIQRTQHHIFERLIELNAAWAKAPRGSKEEKRLQEQIDKLNQRLQETIPQEELTAWTEFEAWIEKNGKGSYSKEEKQKTAELEAALSQVGVEREIAIEAWRRKYGKVQFPIPQWAVEEHLKEASATIEATERTIAEYCIKHKRPLPESLDRSVSHQACELDIVLAIPDEQERTVALKEWRDRYDKEVGL